ncbi:MAG TPA: PIN domain-containing protein [Streptosporangiaceae bacterium]
MVFDPPGHVRLPTNDDEIIDRTLAIQALAAREVTLVTYDTGMSTRARAAGLTVIKHSRPLEEEPVPVTNARTR